MRLSKDKSSWRAGGIIRRDARNAKDMVEVAKTRNSKDTKRWCRGKKGVNHKLAWARGRLYGSTQWWDQRCELCHKKFDYWVRSSWNKRPKPKEITELEYAGIRKL